MNRESEWKYTGMPAGDDEPLVALAKFAASEVIQRPVPVSEKAVQEHAAACVLWAIRVIREAQSQ